MAGLHTASQKPRLALAIFMSLIGLFVLFLCLVVLSAREPGGVGGKIALSDVALRHEASQWFLHADADIDLSPTVRAGLDSGVPLQFIIDIELKEPHQWWFDKTVASFERRYRLTFYELTRHYRVESLLNGDSKNYRSLMSALSGLGTLRHEPMGINDVDIDSERIAEIDSLFGVMRLHLDSRALPLPLQPLLTSSWRLASEDYVWPVN